MSQGAALVISAALTIVVLLTGTGLALRMTASQADSDVDVTADVAQAQADAEDALRQEYIDRLQTSNAALAASYDRITALLDDVDQLKAQNAALLEREAVYQQRLAEANARLQQAGRTVVPSIDTVATDGPSAAFAAESGAGSPNATTESPAPSVLVSSGSPSLPIEPAEPATVAASPPAPVSSTSSALASQAQPVAPTGTTVTASRPVPSIIASALPDPLALPLARTIDEMSRPAPAPPAVQAQTQTSPPRGALIRGGPTPEVAPQRPPPAPPLPSSQSPAVVRLIAAFQTRPTTQTTPAQVSAKPSQSHDGDGDRDDRAGHEKERRNDRRH